MKNKELSRIFANMADYLEMKNDVFRPIAYRRVSFVIEDYPQELAAVAEEGGKEALMKIPGIGENIANKILEYQQTGKIEAYEKLKAATPVNLEELNKIEGLGPKRIRQLYEQLGVTNLSELQTAANKHQIAALEGFGEKSEQNILANIQLAQNKEQRWAVSLALPVALEIENKLKQLREVRQVAIAGSLRRGQPTIGDVDILVVASNPTAVMDYFVQLPLVARIWSKGPTKSSVRSRGGFDVDLRIVPAESWGAALQYFTGPKEHNIALRKIAIKKGFKLNEYGLYHGDKLLTSKQEEDIYRQLGLAYIEPSKRTDQV